MQWSIRLPVREDPKHDSPWRKLAGRVVQRLWQRPTVSPRPLSAEHSQILSDVCLAIRLGLFDEAAAALESIRHFLSDDPSWLNLRGVHYLEQGDWQEARSCFGRAIRADRSFSPAQQNMRRLFELRTFGMSAERLALGDERR
jgi:tetratricopeptide (TPR) repeat protein